MSDTFVDILKYGLWRKHISSDIPVEVANTLMQDADRQTVAGIAFDALSEASVRLEHTDVMKYFAMTQQIIQQNAKVNGQVKALAQLFDREGVDYCIVKGQVAAQCYPKPELRQPGDIDFFCDADNYQNAIEALKKGWGTEIDNSSSDHHVEFKHEGVLFELHFVLLNLYSDKRNDYWKKIIGQSAFHVIEIEGVPVRTLSPTLHSLYVFLHLYHHLMELGVGLRQFCDWAMILHHDYQEISHDELRRHLHELGMERAYRACGCILVDRLGLPANEFSYELDERDHRYAEKILDVVLYRGNMGKYNKSSNFHGWRHNIESTGIKLSHYMKFKSLAPEYSWDWLIYELKRKAANKLK